MELTRRDALAVLAGVGIVTGGGAAVASRGRVEAPVASESPSGGETLDVLVAAAEVVYPSAVSGVREFVETYSLGRMEERPAYREGVREAAAELDRAAREWYDAPYADLDAGTREAVLREFGADAADPDPDGPPAARVRYYVANELLYALYTSPAGGRLVGIENPQGHPGGLEGYQRGSDT